MQFPISKLFIIIAFMVCATNNVIAQSDKDTAYHRKTITAALELCNYKGNYSPLCSDGIEQHYRGSPFLIFLDSLSILANYANVLTYFRYGNVPQFDCHCDSMLTVNPTDRILEIKIVRSETRRINKYLKKYGSKQRFKGILYYKLVKIDGEIKFLQKIKVVVPFPKTGRGRKLIECDVYSLGKIYSIYPFGGKVSYSW